MNDTLQRFLFDNTDIRGELTRLDKSYQDALTSHEYPAVVARLLGELMAASALLSATLKFEGSLTLQARSEGQIPLIMAEVNSEHQLRAIARNADQANSDDFQTLLANGTLSITIDPSDGQRYQGIVSLDGANLAACIEGYFQQSEQLSTRIWLSSDGQQAAGMLLQELPANSDSSADNDPSLREQNWAHMTTLATTVTAEEMLSLPFNELLYRLYNQEQVRLFEPVDLAFHCNCSHQRTLSALRTLGQTELEDIIAEQGAIDINCEFCHQHYHFNNEHIQALFHQTLH
ncbi:MAG: molecular chaperone Hsp33 [Pseudohongiellaceae bacterium]|jgi:molecular chaperone Hsp33